MRIAIVNDLPLAVEALRRTLAERAELEVAWVARDGAQALAQCLQDTPDLILMDLIMPVMDGAEATREIMQRCPCAILVVTATVEGNIDKVFEAMGYGALDAVNTPTLTDSNARQALLDKMSLIGRLIRNPGSTRSADAPKSSEPAGQQKDFMLALGASTGGPQVLATILRNLPADYDGSAVIVQHVDSSFAPGLAQWLDECCPLPVAVAEPGPPPRGRVVVAATDDHLVLRRNGGLAYTPEPLACSYRPSVDAFFTSLARNWSGTGAGVLLTGMGRDGAAGLAALQQAGFETFAQDQDSCVVFGMPRAAIELGAADAVLPVDDIAPALTHAWKKATMRP